MKKANAITYGMFFLLIITSFLFALQFVIRNKICIINSGSDGPTSMFISGKIPQVGPVIIIVVSVLCFVWLVYFLLKIKKK